MLFFHTVFFLLFLFFFLVLDAFFSLCLYRVFFPPLFFLALVAFPPLYLYLFFIPLPLIAL
jgi:hypothetical protein